MFTARSSDQFNNQLTTEPVTDRFTYEYLNSPTGGTGDISGRTGTGGTGDISSRTGTGGTGDISSRTGTGGTGAISSRTGTTY